LKKINTKHSTISNTNSIIKKKEEKKKEETSSKSQCKTQFLFNSSSLMNLENKADSFTRVELERINNARSARKKRMRVATKIVNLFKKSLRELSISAIEDKRIAMFCNKCRTMQKFTGSHVCRYCVIPRTVDEKPWAREPVDQGYSMYEIEATQLEELPRSEQLKTSDSLELLPANSLLPPEEYQGLYKGYFIEGVQLPEDYVETMEDDPSEMPKSWVTHQDTWQRAMPLISAVVSARQYRLDQQLGKTEVKWMEDGKEKRKIVYETIFKNPEQYADHVNSKSIRVIPSKDEDGNETLLYRNSPLDDMIFDTNQIAYETTTKDESGKWIWRVESVGEPNISARNCINPKLQKLMKRIDLPDGKYELVEYTHQEQIDMYIKPTWERNEPFLSTQYGDLCICKRFSPIADDRFDCKSSTANLKSPEKIVYGCTCNIKYPETKPSGELVEFDPQEVRMEVVGNYPDEYFKAIENVEKKAKAIKAGTHASQICTVEGFSPETGAAQYGTKAGWIMYWLNQCTEELKETGLTDGSVQKDLRNFATVSLASWNLFMWWSNEKKHGEGARKRAIQNYLIRKSTVEVRN